MHLSVQGYSVQEIADAIGITPAMVQNDLAGTARLFRELWVALPPPVAISAFVSLTLTPMMASKLLRPHTGPHAVHGNRVSEWIDARFKRLAAGYRGLLDRHVHRIGLFAGLMAAAVVALVLLFKLLPSELAPTEDRGEHQNDADGHR